MIESFKIAANLTITGDALKTMKAFNTIVNTTAKSTKILQNILKELSGTMRNVNRSFDYFNEGLIATEGNTQRLRYQTDTLRNSMRSLTSVSRQANASINRIGVGGGGGGGSTSSRSNSFGFARNLINFLPGRLGQGLAIGGIGGAAAFAVGGLGYAGYNSQVSYQRSMLQLQTMGLSPTQMAEARNFTSLGVHGVSPINQAQALVDAQMATQDFGKAKALAPILAQGKAFAQVTYGGMSDDQIKSAIRVAEMRGGGDPKMIGNQLNTVFRMMALSGGSIMPNDLLGFMRRGAITGSRLSDLGLLSLEPVMQELKGNTTGFALTTLRQFLIGGTGMTKNRANDLQAMGLLGAVQYDSNGRPVGNKFGSVSKDNMNLLSSDPFAFLTNVILPAYRKHGIVDSNDIEQKLTYDFPRLPAQLLGLMVKNMPKELLERGNLGNLKDLNALSVMKDKTPGGANYNLGQAWGSFTNAIGLFSTPAIQVGIKSLTVVLEKMATFLTGMYNLDRGVMAFGHDVLTLSHAGGFGNWFSKKITVAPALGNSSSQRPINTSVNLHIDGHRFAGVTARAIVNASHPQYDMGQTGTNSGLIPTPISLPGFQSGSISN